MDGEGTAAVEGLVLGVVVEGAAAVSSREKGVFFPRSYYIYCNIVQTHLHQFFLTL